MALMFQPLTPALSANSVQNESKSRRRRKKGGKRNDRSRSERSRRG